MLLRTLDCESIVLRLKSEVAQAHAELLEAEMSKSKWKQQPDSFRTEPYLFDTDGHAYWKLKGYNDGDNVLLQDMGTGDPFVSSDEQWFSYGAETKEAAENYYCSTRMRSLLTPTLSQTLPSSSKRAATKASPRRAQQLGQVQSTFSVPSPPHETVRLSSVHRRPPPPEPPGSMPHHSLTARDPNLHGPTAMTHAGIRHWPYLHDHQLALAQPKPAAKPSAAPLR